jgi:hypothetical protein
MSRYSTSAQYFGAAHLSILFFRFGSFESGEVRRCHHPSARGARLGPTCFDAELLTVGHRIRATMEVI